jgi:tRNA(adenine34) deaminase
MNIQQNPLYQTHCHWMKQAIALAQQAGDAGEVPVGALVVGPDQALLSQAQNRRERDGDPTAHAEILALRQAGIVLKSWHLTQCQLYVTLEPCPMCAGALVLSRIGEVIYGTSDPKSGALRSALNLFDSAASNHAPPVVSGILARECSQQLQEWFKANRRGGPAR